MPWEGGGTPTLPPPPGAAVAAEGFLQGKPGSWPQTREPLGCFEGR